MLETVAGVPGTGWVIEGVSYKDEIEVTMLNG